MTRCDIADFVVQTEFNDFFFFPQGPVVFEGPGPLTFAVLLYCFFFVLSSKCKFDQYWKVNTKNWTEWKSVKFAYNLFELGDLLHRQGISNWISSLPEEPFLVLTTKTSNLTKFVHGHSGEYVNQSYVYVFAK
jgi:hypothetical protein